MHCLLKCIRVPFFWSTLVFRGTLKNAIPHFSQPCLPFYSWDLGCKLTSMVINIANSMMGQPFHFVAGIMEGL
jgi:hypothetical protein